MSWVRECPTDGHEYVTILSTGEPISDRCQHCGYWRNGAPSWLMRLIRRIT